MQTDDNWKHIAGETQVLVRSRLEILQMLNSALLLQAAVCVYLPRQDKFFVSRLRAVDPDGIGIGINYCENRAANAAVLSARSVTMQSSCRRGLIEFVAADVVEGKFGGAPVLRFAVPEMVVVRQRRACKRISVLPRVPLRCIADNDGPIAFNAEIIDISLTGLGAMIYDPHITLAPGLVLRGCRITHSGRSAAVLDLEVLYSKDVVLPDDRLARMSGCRFVNQTPELEDLMRVFITDLERGYGNED